MVLSAKSGKYIYAMILGPGAQVFAFKGLEEKPVYTITCGKVAAVVSDVPNENIRPERRHLTVQQTVLKGLMQETLAVLPMSFGTIAESTRAVKEILTRNYDTLAMQLQRVAGKVEMGLRVAWNVPNIFEYFVSIHAELRAARDQFLGTYRVPTQEDKIEVGRLFDRILREDREEYMEKVEAILSPLCFEIKRSAIRNEKEVMSLACLVERKVAEKDFEAAIFEAARGFDNNFTFDFNGPWAPHNFVDVELSE